MFLIWSSVLVTFGAGLLSFLSLCVRVPCQRDPHLRGDFSPLRSV
jgi:hypothetical protein